ncbi:MAG: hypothetical protein CBD97_00575 [Pelagibacteraceae bacterium TMED237]|nr:MAG: hypothetical protein CBD97_00575 [Pelagibacteraceae bacterium TMED237]|tara:strand:- start:3740 stop:5050 length:1311 start_codon:yes stop_codon:yes gene_type:complete
MINLLKKLLFFNFVCFFSLPLFAFSSSSFLISQSAFKNHDYPSTLFNFNANKDEFTNDDLLDRVIAAVIIEDLYLANKIATKILLEDSTSQEAYIVTLVYSILNKKFQKIEEINNNIKEKNKFIDFIFFNSDKLKSSQSISKAFIDIVISSFSNSDERSLNYNFLLFYTSLAKIIDNQNDRAILIKGELFQYVKQNETAKKIFEIINSDSPYYLEAQKSLAINYSNFYEFDEALQNIKLLLKNNNNHYSIKKILADFYRINKKYKSAIEVYNEMIKLKEDEIWNMYYRRGICYERLGDWKNAEKDFIKSLDIKSDSPNVLNYLAYGWIEREIRLDQSLAMLKQAYQANPDSYYIIDSLAWAHYKKNNLDEAARLMEKVIDIAPGEAISLDHLGDIYYAMDRKREAFHFWKQALQLAEPEDEIEEEVQSKIENLNAG